MTGKEFINQVLIKDIGDLVETKPFFAFTLMAVGIEFLGKCLSSNPWNTTLSVESSSSVFEDALQTYNSLKRYKDLGLYHHLRCGLAHYCMVGASIQLSPEKNNLDVTPTQIGCKEFYNNFKEACNDAINNKDNIIKKQLDDEFCDISSDGVTGSTIP